MSRRSAPPRGSRAAPPCPIRVVREAARREDDVRPSPSPRPALRHHHSSTIPPPPPPPPPPPRSAPASAPATAASPSCTTGEHRPDCSAASIPMPVFREIYRRLLRDGVAVPGANIFLPARFPSREELEAAHDPAYVDAFCSRRAGRARDARHRVPLERRPSSVAERWRRLRGDADGRISRCSAASPRTARRATHHATALGNPGLHPRQPRGDRRSGKISIKAGRPRGSWKDGTGDGSTASELEEQQFTLSCTAPRISSRSRRAEARRAGRRDARGVRGTTPGGRERHRYARASRRTTRSWCCTTRGWTCTSRTRSGDCVDGHAGLIGGGERTVLDTCVGHSRPDRRRRRGANDADLTRSRGDAASCTTVARALQSNGAREGGHQGDGARVAGDAFLASTVGQKARVSVPRHPAVAAIQWWYTLLVSGADDGASRRVHAIGSAYILLDPRAVFRVGPDDQSPSGGLGTGLDGILGAQARARSSGAKLRVLDARLDLAHQAVALVARAREGLRPPAAASTSRRGRRTWRRRTAGRGARANAERTKRNARGIDPQILVTTLLENTHETARRTSPLQK